jgi:hypothetical protein
MMIIVNKPQQLIDVQCYKCKAIFQVYPLTNMNADWITNCDKHRPDIQMNHSQDDVNRCQHEHDGMIYTSNPPQNKCIKCGEFYR